MEESRKKQTPKWHKWLLGVLAKSLRRGVEVAKKKESLTAKELLQEVFDTLQKKLKGVEVVFPSRALAVIGNDSDHHRTRIGYTRYLSATLVTVKGKAWAIAFGTKYGDYPADSYNCDIAAVEVPDGLESDLQVEEAVHEALTRNSYFRSSLIIAMRNGGLGAAEGKRFGGLATTLRQKLQEFIAQERETDPNHCTTDWRPVVTRNVLYKREFVDFLAETFQAALEDISPL